MANFDCPKTTGQLQIPALTIDGIASQPINLQVAPQGSQPQQAKNLFIRTSLSTEQAYVGQLVTYKVKLFLAVELQRGVLSAPNIEGASIKQLGEDVDTTELVNGRRYRVIERTYAIIADKAGDLDISGADFQGTCWCNHSAVVACSHLMKAGRCKQNLAQRH